MVGRSGHFATAQANCKSVSEAEFYEMYKDLTWPTDKELKRMIRKQVKLDRKRTKHPGKFRLWLRYLRKPKLSFRGIKMNGSVEKYKEAIALRVSHHLQEMKEYERRQKKRP